MGYRKSQKNSGIFWLLSGTNFQLSRYFTDSSNTGSIIVPSGCGEKYKDAVGEKFARFVKEMAPPRLEVTEAALSEKLQEILNELPVSNSTTMDAAMRDVKKALDDYFLSTSTIQSGYYALTRANYERDGLIVLEMTAFCDRYSVTKQVTKSVPKLTLELEKAWMLDEDGNLVISDQEGMDGWMNNGRTEEDIAAVKNLLIWGDVKEIPDNAFSGCSNLEYASISETVTSIGNSAFADCSSLEKVVMQGTTPPSMGSSVFDGCKFVTDSENTEGIVVPPGSEDTYREEGGIFGEFIKAEKSEVTEEALKEKLQKIFDTLPASNDTTRENVIDTVKSLIDDYFHIDSVITIAGFDILEKATIDSEGLLSLAITARYGECLAKVEGTIPIAKLPPLPDRGWTLDEAGNLVIGSQAGMDDWTLNGRAEGKYTAVKRVLIQGDVTGIPDSAFSGCGNLEAIVIPDTVTSIGSQAFMHASLSEITLPPNLQSIGDSAFSDCSSLEKVVLQGTTPPSIGTSVFAQCKFVTDSTKGIVVPSGSSDAYRASWGDTLGESILEKHTHSFGADLNSDELNHWNECICGAKGNVVSHAWSDGVVVIPPTAAEAGMMGYVCPECQATRMEPIPATGGSPSVSGGNNSSVSGNGNPSVSGNGNPGSNPTVSGNDNPNGGGSGDGTSVPGNGNSGDGTSVPGNGNSGGGISVPGNGGSGDGAPVPGNGNPGGGTSDPGSSNSGDGSLVYSGSMQQPDNSNELALFWSALNAKTQKDTEPKTADGVPLELYATVAMIAGFFYLLLLFLDKYDITEEKRRESLARLVKWAKCGGWIRKLPVMAVLLLMRTYYRIVDGQGPKRKKI